MQPLERDRALNVEGKTSWVSFRYEKLPQFCFNCGHLVHDEKGCPVTRSTKLSSVDGTKQWRPWLRADEPKRKVPREWSRRSWENAGQYQEESHGQAGGDWRNVQSLWKESNANFRNPSPIHARRSALFLEGTNNSPKRHMMGVTQNEEENQKESEGESIPERDAGNKEAFGGDREQDSWGEWSTSLNDTAEKNGKQAIWEEGSGKGPGNGSGPPSYGPRRNGGGIQLSWGQNELTGSTTPMDLTPTSQQTATETDSPTPKVNTLEARSATKMNIIKEDTSRKLKGANLCTWKRMARVETKMHRTEEGP